MKLKKIDSFFKKRSTETTQPPLEKSQIEVPPSSLALLNSDARPSKIPRVEDEALDFSNLERKLGLSLVAIAREVVEVHQFFKDLSDIVHIVSASSKRHDELQKAQAVEITHLVSINELATGTRMNQIGTLQCPDTQLQELNSRFNKNVVKLLTLTTALDPKEFFKSLGESGKSVMYPLVDRLNRLILTLPISTTSSERALSAMKIVKT
ncbi:hypothetical protein PVK06_019865 [Gossypium arboreum]|uniref:HAT C-terminal dimerisation domain-containing protein n=1 Tax=Gossypium arboreum TaxID=29729 RepID=A0ABR0PL02_GOSAR|nr:hypothetical protein PVK06_019865 [Gossypium arboreum]